MFCKIFIYLFVTIFQILIQRFLYLVLGNKLLKKKNFVRKYGVAQEKVVGIWFNHEEDEDEEHKGIFVKSLAKLLIIVIILGYVSDNGTFGSLLPTLGHL